MAKGCHPDLHGGSEQAEQRFKEVCIAYETLANPTARAAYDAECAALRAQARRRMRSVATTMAASFTLTVGSGIAVAGWLLGS
jgi:molecular chaperone DnaJ